MPIIFARGQLAEGAAEETDVAAQVQPLVPSLPVAGRFLGNDGRDAPRDSPVEQRPPLRRRVSKWDRSVVLPDLAGLEKRVMLPGAMKPSQSHDEGRGWREISGPNGV